MLCNTDILAEESYLSSFRKRISDGRIPVSASLELTRRCNFRCVHCYLGDLKNQNGRRDELPTRRWLEVLDELTELGCLFVLFTGGEPLMREDFPGIYRKAKMNGMLVTVFTNGTTVTDSVIDLFSDLPPQAVEITVYGASSMSYRAITGRSEAFDVCLQTIKKLVKREINVKLKTMLLSLNYREIEEIRAIANDFSLSFKFDPVVTVAIDGDVRPSNFRAPVGEIVRKQLGSEENRAAWRRGLESIRWDPQVKYNCGAGLNTLYVDATGTMRPCIVTTDPCFDLRRTDVRSGWAAMSSIRQEVPPPRLDCTECADRQWCSFCPPSILREADSETRGFYCELARQRRKVLESHLESERI